MTHLEAAAAFSDLANRLRKLADSGKPTESGAHCLTGIEVDAAILSRRCIEAGILQLRKDSHPIIIEEWPATERVTIPSAESTLWQSIWRLVVERVGATADPHVGIEVHREEGLTITMVSAEDWDERARRQAVTCEWLSARFQQRGQKRTASHSIDFACVNWFGTSYEFTPSQAACIGVLWENWERGTPIVGEASILERANVSSELRHVFRGHAAWGTMITSPSKGRYRLTEPFFEHS